jgi:hypothetical protein
MDVEQSTLGVTRSYVGAALGLRQWTDDRRLTGIESPLD